MLRLWTSYHTCFPEDVKSFEKAVVSRAAESRRVKQPRAETDQSEAEIEDVSQKKRVSLTVLELYLCPTDHACLVASQR